VQESENVDRDAENKGVGEALFVKRGEFLGAVLRRRFFCGPIVARSSWRLTMFTAQILSDKTRAFVTGRLRAAVDFRCEDCGRG
jgi:hypothetical protein